MKEGLKKLSLFLDGRYAGAVHHCYVSLLLFFIIFFWKDRIDALKCQIQFQKFVPQQQEANKTLFQWSSEGKSFLWKELKNNLMELISLSKM